MQLKPAGLGPARRFDGLDYFICFILQGGKFLTQPRRIALEILVTTFRRGFYLLAGGELFSFQRRRGVLQAGQRGRVFEGK